MSVAVNGNSAMLSNDSHVSLTFIGASCNAGLLPMTKANIITFSPEKGRNAVIAVTTYYNPPGKDPIQKDQFFIGATWEEGVLVVNLNKNFISPLGRLGSINDDGDIETLANGQRFISINTKQHPLDEHLQKEKDRLIAKGYRLIDDPNLICKYLIGDANEADLEFAATEDNRSQTERELGKARQQLAEQTDVLERNRQTVKAAIADVEEARATIQRLTEEKKALEKKNDEDKADFVSFVVKISRIIQASRFGNRGLTLNLIGTRVSDFLRENPSKKN